MQLHLKEAKSQEEKISSLATEATRLAKENSDFLTREKSKYGGSSVFALVVTLTFYTCVLGTG